MESGEGSGGVRGLSPHAAAGQTTAYVTQTDGYLQVRNKDQSRFRQCQGSGVIRYVPYDPDPAFSNKFQIWIRVWIQWLARKSIYK